MTYEELVEKYPQLALRWSWGVATHENLVMAAYLAGRAERLEEEIAHDQERLAKLNIKREGK